MNGFSSGSLFGIVSVAVRAPLSVGVNVTVKLVLPPPVTLDPVPVVFSENIPASAPLRAIGPNVTAVPGTVSLMTKVCARLLPRFTSP